MKHDPLISLSRELEAKSTLIDQIRALTADDADFFVDVIEGQTNLIELIGALDASIVDDEILVDGAKIALEKLQNRKRAAENRIDLKRRLLTQALNQIGLKTLRTPTSTLSITSAPIKAIVVTPEDVPSRWWRPQAPKLDQDALTKAIRAREKALQAAEAVPDPDERQQALSQAEALHPPIPGVTASNGGVTLIRRV